MSGPEDWINKQVAIGISGVKPQLILGELLEVSDRGVTISVPVGVSTFHHLLPLACGSDGPVRIFC